MNSIFIPPDVLPLFEKAGWLPSRKIDLPSEITEKLPETHPSIEILSRFAELRVYGTEEGEECATGDIEFLIPPDSYLGRLDQTWGGWLKTRLVFIGEIDNGGFELYIDSSGRCFGNGLIHDAFCFVGDSFGEAIQRILLGKRYRSMLRPDQKSVTLSGIHYNAQSPELYKYE